MHRRRIFAMLLLGAVLFGGCRPAAPTASPTAEVEATAVPTSTPTPDPNALYLAIIWHQHQPVYFKDPETGLYAKPWVRLHAAKDYVDMAAMLEDYPNVHVTFNLTPSLLRQLDDIAAGARDAYWAHTLIPADQLGDDDKRFILRYFFDINPKIIERFPRYLELQAKRPTDEEGVEAAIHGGWSEQDFRDLQVLFNLAWVDPDWLAQEPLADLVAKGRDFSEEDKQVVLDEHIRLVQEVVPIHRRLQEAGQIEVTMTPFAHPILPLLIDTNLAKEAMPSAELPAPPFRYGRDAVAQIERGIELYREHFDRDPAGMWPAEGAVAQAMVNMVGRAGLRWMASDEGVLAKSLGMDGFARNGDDVVQQADALYRPYTVQGADGIPVAMVFRDHVLSDKVGFTYSGLPGEVAAGDFVQRLHAIKDELAAEGAAGPHLVTVILDGENAWEYYENDGKDFLRSLYQRLSDDPEIVTVTPSEYLALFPDEPSASIEKLWAGSWIDHSFSTWIGEDEENRAWDYLRQVREVVQKYENGTRTPPSEAALEEALTQLYIAEGSDWFWWYGADQNSGSDEDFDRQYRETLKAVFRALGEEPPAWLDVPIIAQQAASPAQAATALITPQVDGRVEAGEWDAAGYYAVGGGAMAATTLPLKGFAYGFDAHTLYLRVDTAQEGGWAALTAAQSTDARSVVGFYFQVPGGGAATAFSRYGGTATYLGFGANRLLELSFDGDGQFLGAQLYAYDGDAWQPTDEAVEAAVQGGTLEVGLPLASLAPDAEGGTLLDSGDRLSVRLVFGQGMPEAMSDVQELPADGPALLVVPDLGLTTQVLAITDPEGDDHGPGSYTYPTDPVFKPGVFDATSFSVGYDDRFVVFRFTLRGPLENVWGSPNGLSVQTFDIYIDTDGPQAGERLLLPGRNAALTPEFAWDYAIWVEGWTPQVVVPGEEGPQQIDAEIIVITDPGQHKVTIKVPRSVLEGDPAAWSYAAAVLGQEGFPSAGVWRVRDVEVTAKQWRFGGAPADANHTRIIDLLWPEGISPTQEDLLNTYLPTTKLPETPAPDDFAQIPMLTLQ